MERASRFGICWRKRSGTTALGQPEDGRGWAVGFRPSAVRVILQGVGRRRSTAGGKQAA